MEKKLLMEILLDPHATDAEKDDAVIDLGENFENEETIDFLLKISNLNSTNEMIAASCGESLGYIWLRKEEINYDKLFYLKGIALIEALSLIQARRPEWFEEYKRLLNNKE
ncbi:hypothetical protein [Paenibacillus lutrae]|nr:hypothetical protein [Paenibacillus lutrae]